ncbi:MAG: ASCH domain-containing protein [Candidatus Aenigmatarchaeota archaeon]
MWIKRRFFDLILSGEKTLEVRVLYPNLRSIQKGELVNLNNQATIRIKDVRKYSTFEEMLSKEDASRIVPGSNREEVLKLLKSLYPPHKEQMGVLVLEVEPVR